MKPKSYLQSAWMLLLALGMFAGVSHADMTLVGLDHSFQLTGNTSITLESKATVLISLPNGDTHLVEKQSEVPADLTGASVDVFSGCVSASGGNGVSLCVGDNQGKAVALAGGVSLVTDIGKAITLNEGDEYYIAFAGEFTEELAPPTADLGDISGSPTGGFNPFDGTGSGNQQNQPPSP